MVGLPPADDWQRSEKTEAVAETGIQCTTRYEIELQLVRCDVIRTILK